MLLDKSINPVDHEYARLDVYWQELIQMPGQSVLVIAGDEPTRKFTRTWLNQKQQLDDDCRYYIEWADRDREDGLYGRAFLRALAESVNTRAELAQRYRDDEHSALHWLPRRDLEPEGYGDVESLAYNARSFVDFYRSEFDGLIVAIEFDDSEQFQSWLFNFINVAETKDFYIIALVSEQRPIEIESKKLIYRHHHHDAELLLKKLVTAYDDGSAEGKLRVLQVEISQAKPESIAELQQPIDDALAIIDGEGWFQQRLALHLIAGNKWLQLDCHKQAIASFEQAIDDFDRCDDPPEDCYQLKIYGCFGAAMMHKMQGDHIEAGSYYALAAAEADAQDNVNLSCTAHHFAADSYRQGEEPLGVRLTESQAAGHCEQAFRKLQQFAQPADAPIDAGMFVDVAMKLSKQHSWQDVWPQMTEEMAMAFPEDLIETKYRELRS